MSSKRSHTIQEFAMKREEELGADRVLEIGTDDEGNEAETACSDENDTGSDCSTPCIEPQSPTWPQSYRQSIDMYTSFTASSLSFLSGGSLASANKNAQSYLLPESQLTRPLISETSSDKEVPTSTLTRKLSFMTGSRSSIADLPPPQQCTYVQTILNAINALCGIGILTTPYALKEGGWSSLLLLLIFGIFTCYTGILLKRCLESSPGLKTYPDIGEAAFGVAGRMCIAIILYMELYSSCVEYLIMICDNLSSMFPNANLDVAGIHLDSYKLFAIISTLVILPTVWLRDLSLLSYISAGGVITLVVVVLCLFWVGIIDEVGFHPSGTALNLAKLPVTIGLYSFCYGSHSVFPNIYSSMKEPSKFPSVLLISFSVACISYAGVAICGFLMFSDSTEPQFTLNLPGEFVATKVAGWAVVVTPLTKYAITALPVAFGLEELLPSKWLGSYAVSIFIRTLLVVSTLIIALTVPYFGFVMALIGSLLVMLVSLILPCACYMKISRGSLPHSQVVVCSIITIVGLLCSIIGTYSAVSGIADQKA